MFRKKYSYKIRGKDRLKVSSGEGISNMREAPFYTLLLYLQKPLLMFCLTSFSSPARIAFSPISKENESPSSCP
jgi:hypothetical protein